MVQDYAKAEMPADEFFLDYDIETCEAKYSPVNTGSIAGAMLRNFAYAKNEARLDNLRYCQVKSPKLIGSAHEYI
jgi:hypothetical protein